jgi:hypothetical protein
LNDVLQITVEGGGTEKEDGEGREKREREE